MSRISLALAASIAIIALAACSASPIAPSDSPSAPPVVIAPSESPDATPAPSVTPPPATPAPTKAPVGTPRPPTPRPTAVAFNAAEQHLLDGVQRDTKNCEPAGGIEDLPGDALAGIECDSTDPAVARVGFYLFANDQDMIDAYMVRMRDEGIELDSGSCAEGEAENAYYPGEGFILERAACFVNDEGFANYRYTTTGWHVYVGVLGRSKDMVALETFAWKGSLDTPGIPTLWNGGID